MTPAPPTQVGSINEPVSAEVEPRRKTIVVLMVSLVILPMLYYAGCREISRWYQAVSRKALLDEQYESSLAALKTAERWNPGDLAILSDQAEWYLSMANAQEAAKIATRALELARKRAVNPTPDNTDNLIKALNLSAYARALCESDLPAALKDADEALTLYGDSPGRSGLLDTRGYLYYLTGDNEHALADLELAMQLYEIEEKALRAHYRDELRLSNNQRSIEAQLKQLDETKATLFQHRGLARAKAGETLAAAKDFAQAKKLGFNPEAGVW